jgi:GNAT superfamily N-acetyltransferase
MSVTIRPARADDYSTFSRLFPELEVPDPVPERGRFETEMMPTSLIAEDGMAGLGIVYYQVLQGVGFVRMIMVDPAARRRGVGRALMIAARDIFTRASCAEWRLNTFPHNTRAIPLYESLGLRRVHLNRVVRVAWSLLDHATAAPGVCARPIEPSDDARVEAATNLLPGQLPDARAKQGRVLVLLEDDAKTVLGGAIFDPSFPGAYPFRVTRPELATTLLLALRPHALAEQTFVGVVCENQPEVADALLALGGTLTLETQHMRGPLT